MSGNEIISIYLGPYANYVGAFLTNQEHFATFNTALPYTISQYTTSSQNSDGSEAKMAPDVDPTILFTPCKTTRFDSDQTRSTASHNTYFIPRAIYCDFDGAIPIHHANSIATQHFKQTKKNAQSEDNFDPLMLYEDSFSSYQSLYNSTQGDTKRTNKTEDAAVVSHEHLYWHNILYPHLRPMTNCPENVILTSASHVLGVSGDVFTESPVLLSKPVSPTSSKHEETFGETLFNQFRLLIEHAEQPQGVRVFFDPTSIWGGVAFHLLQHINNDYPTLVTMLVGVSTPFSIDNTSTSFPTELFASQSYQIPYSPFFSDQLINPSAIKQQTLQLREKRLLNTSIFTSHLPNYDKCFYIPLTFPLTTALQIFVSTKIPNLVQKYQQHLTKREPRIDKNGELVNKLSQQSILSSQSPFSPHQSIPVELQTTIISISNAVQQYKGVLFQFLTSPHISLSLFPLFQSLYSLKPSSTGSSSNAAFNTVATLSQLLYTVRPRSNIPLSTLAHQHHPALLSQSILAATPSQALSPVQQNIIGGENKQLFPTLDLPHNIASTSIPILSNLYQSLHDKQLKMYQRQVKVEGTMQITGNGNGNGDNSQQQQQQQQQRQGSMDQSSTQSMYQSLFGGDDEEDPQRAKYQATVQMGSNMTICHFDLDATLTPINQQTSQTTNSVVNGVFQHTNSLQYEYECQQRYKSTQRELYSYFSLSKPSSFFIIPNLLRPTPYIPHVFYTPSQMQSYSEINQLFYAKPTPPEILSKPTSTFPINLAQHKSYESVTTAFISPQLSTTMNVFANNFRRAEKLPVRQAFRDLESDDWVECYNGLANLGLEYKEVDVYTLDEDFLD